MKPNLSALLLLAMLSIFSQSCNTEKTTEEKVAKPKAEEKLTGTRTSYFEDDSTLVMSEVEYVKGVRHGSAKDYYKSGQIRLQGAFVDGEENGELIWYYENGNIYKRIGYLNGAKHGWDSLFFESGYHKHAVPYKNGILQEGTKEWSTLHKEIALPKITLRHDNRIALEGKYYFYAKFTEPVKDVIFESGIIGNGTKENPEGAFETMVLENDAAQEAMYFVNLAPGREIIGKLVIKGRGKTKRGNPFMVYQIWPVVMR